jgi:membrane-associated phospholipid phosphatase
MTILQAQLSSVIERLLMWINGQDQLLMIYINRVLTNSFLDSAFPIWRESITWYPLYLFLLVFMLINFGMKAWSWILFLIITVILTDQISSSFLKDFFNRTRPCSDPFFSHYVRLLMNRCPSSGSFTSSHATNHFGAAVFISLTMKPYFKNWRYLFFFWAATVSYGQVYVGVHYPTDVMGGALLGSLIGYGTAAFFNRRIGISPTEITAMKVE